MTTHFSFITQHLKTGNFLSASDQNHANTPIIIRFLQRVYHTLDKIMPLKGVKGVKPQPIVDTLSELCSPFSAFNAMIASGSFLKREYR